jgi:very-short-patch-repair endonuclease
MTETRLKPAQLRRKQTSAEVKLWSALRGERLNGWKFRRQHPIDRYIVDFVCLDAKLIIEVDGATHSTDAELERDAVRTQTLETCGFFVLRLTNADVFDNLGGVLETILAAIEQRDHIQKLSSMSSLLAERRWSALRGEFTPLTLSLSP